jgi:pimeloyl-ACP methyl ester carboxylesterase
LATFLLVHGAWGGAWSWDQVIPRLTAAGHVVHAPDLTGLGARAHLRALSINLSTHIEDITAVLDAHRLSDVVLVGHSYGGMVVTGVASRAAARIADLVYLDAFLPQNGQALWDLSGAKMQDWLISSARQGHGFTSRPPRDYDPFRDDPRFVTHPLACFVEPVALTGAERTIRRRRYIRAAKYDPSPFAAPYQACVMDPAWETAEIATGHNTMLEDPQATASLLMS